MRYLSIPLFAEVALVSPRLTDRDQRRWCSSYSVVSSHECGRDYYKTRESQRGVRAEEEVVKPLPPAPDTHYDPLVSPSVLTTSTLTATNGLCATGAGVTAAAGTRLALQLILAKEAYFRLIPITRALSSLASLFFVTTSPIEQGVICAPAAFLRCGSRLSGSLSGTKPQSPVTRYYFA